MKNLIKKHIYLLMLPLAFTLLVSCSEDDESAIGDSSDLVGTWTISGVEVEFTVDGTDFIQWFVDNLELSNEDAQAFQTLFEEEITDGFTGTFTFNEDGSYSAVFGLDDETGTWTLDGSQLTIVSNVTNDGPSSFTLLTLNSNLLVLEFSETEIEDLDEDGTSETLSISFQLSLSK